MAAHGRLGRGARRRARYPRRQGAQGPGSPVEVIFTKLHAGREVQRRVLQRDRRPARCRCLRRERALVPHGRRRGPPAVTSGHVLPARLPGSVRRRGPGGEVRGEVGADPQGPAWPRASPGTRVRFWPDRQIFTKDATFVFDELITRARQTSFIVPGLELVIRDLRGSEPRGSSATMGGSRSSPSSSRPTSRSPRSCGCRAWTRSPRPCRC